MESLSIFKFWRNVTGADTSSIGDSFRNVSDDETDYEESFFDLVFKSPDCANNDETKKEFHFVESPRDVFMSEKNLSMESDSKLLSSPISLLKSRPALKAFTLGFRKAPKSEKIESGDELPVTRLSRSSKREQSIRFNVKCNVKCKSEDAPIAISLTRDNSLRSRLVKESSEAAKSKPSVPKFLKLIKPLYVMASKRENEKAKMSNTVAPLSSPVAAPVNFSPRKLSESGRVGSFKIVTKHLGKSRSASSAVGMSPPPINRRDTALLQQHEDGIQGAILHCKKSYNSSQLSRSSSDPSNQKMNSWEEQKRCSI